MALKFEVNLASVWLHGSSWQSPERAGLALPRLRIQLPLPEGPQAADPILGGTEHLTGGKEGRAEEDSPHVEPVASPHVSAELDRGRQFPVPPVSGTHTWRAVDEARI